MIDCGQHSHLVEDVLSIAKSGVLSREFSFPEIDGELVRVTKSLEGIQRFQYPEIENALIMGDRHWFDIKRVDEEAFRLGPNDTDTTALREQYLPFLESNRRLIFQWVAIQTKGIIPQDDEWTIAEDLDGIAFTRAVRGLLPGSFEERLFSIYRAGGYPCGWEGEFPAGRLVVFSR